MRFEEELTANLQLLQIDEYSRLLYSSEDVFICLQYPNDKEERRDYLSFDEFYKMIVTFNCEYDKVLMIKGERPIDPKARIIIDEIYGKQAGPKQ